MDLLLDSFTVLAIAFAFAVFLPGIERKVQARIQRRYGPPVTTPGLWNIAKAFFKQNVTPNSPNPLMYQLFVLVSITSVSLILLISNPLWWGFLGFSSVFAVMGLFKVEEVVYLFMGSFSKSIMSLKMPFPDLIKGAKESDVRRFFEEISAARSLKMITLGSFPIYVALFVPFAAAGSLFIPNVVILQNPLVVLSGTISLESIMVLLSMWTPFLLTVPGIICAVVYFIGYNILTNTRPFDIIKPKIDVIEGPVMEYASVWRGFYVFFTGLLSFTLSSLFITVFLGIPLLLSNQTILFAHLLLIPILPILSATLKAFSPVFTFKQILPISMASSALAFIALALTYAGF
ncbi:MAG: NADH-quinone oxidoreductase subunit H [Candidatus Altiarchaeota archaeon]|nr:NADH-quinone oxidoreductase subunit H [Candidatus Altiarchaeota archaeon]